MGCRSGSAVGDQDAAVGYVGLLDLLEDDPDGFALGAEDGDRGVGDGGDELAALVEGAAGEEFDGNVRHKGSPISGSVCWDSVSGQRRGAPGGSVQESAAVRWAAASAVWSGSVFGESIRSSTSERFSGVRRTRVRSGSRGMLSGPPSSPRRATAGYGNDYYPFLGTRHPSRAGAPRYEDAGAAQVLLRQVLAVDGDCFARSTKAGSRARRRLVRALDEGWLARWTRVVGAVR